MATPQDDESDPSAQVLVNTGLTISATPSGANCTFFDSQATCGEVTIFNQGVVSGFIREKNWDGLKAYLQSFISNNPHDGVVHLHKGLMLTLYELQLTMLLEEEKYDTAVDLFKDSVFPLLALTDDNLFAPLDLSDRVLKIGSFVRDKKNFPMGWEAARTTALFDYIRLYFPHAIRLQVEDGGNALLQFVRVYEDEFGKQRYRCLACGWSIPLGQSLNTFAHHIRHRMEQLKNKNCSGLTINLLRRMNQSLNIVEGEPDFATFVLAYNTPKKRKIDEGSGSSSDAGSNTVESLGTGDTSAESLGKEVLTEGHVYNDPRAIVGEISKTNIDIILYS
ncbi:hypothetical protein EJB05_02804 [Eragrostis curvula]|uniref:Uncharacterized protein n=1 Tax=Eragrostis curvula TaxID=38414 RepID=A0A5J9WT08_9POAL|nr:hypothetical protein EJB05_02804 [Eragrostis curvula]